MRFLKKLFHAKPFIPYQLFGEEGIRQLVRKFYEVMENDPNAEDCLKTHELIDGKVPDPVKEKLFDFLSGWLGGPNLFIRKRGPPRMRARHARVSIGAREREQWLYCMNKALDDADIKLKRSEKSLMRNSFAALAIRIQNA